MDGTGPIPDPEPERGCPPPEGQAEAGFVDEAQACLGSTRNKPGSVDEAQAAEVERPVDPVSSKGGAGTALTLNRFTSVPEGVDDLHPVDPVSSSSGGAEVARPLDGVSSSPGGAAGIGWTLMDLPTALLVTLLRHVSKEEGLGGPLHFALVCRRFAAARFHATALRVRPSPSPRDAADLAQQLQQFRGPTLLQLPPFSLKAPEELWKALGDHDPSGSTLTALATGLGTTRSNPRPSSIDVAEREHEHGRVTRHFSVYCLLPNPGLRTLRLSLASSVRARPWVLCSPVPERAMSPDELRTHLPLLMRLSLDNVNPGWHQDWPAALPRLRSLHIRGSCREGHAGDADATGRCAFPWSVLGMAGLTSLSLCPGSHSIQGRDFGRLTNLRRLAIRISEPGGQPAPSIWRLTRLTSLSLSHDKYGGWDDRGFDAFPVEVARLTALRELTLSVRKAREEGEGVQELPVPVLQALGRSLRVLRLSIHHTAYVTQSTGVLLPQRFGAHLSGLRELTLGGSVSSASLEHELAGLARLERLSLRGIKHAPLPRSSILGMIALEELNLVSCFSLAELPPWLAALARLRRLSIDSCDRLVGLPPSLAQLTQLQSLELKCLPLRELPGSIGALQQLRRLVLFGLQRLEHSALAGVYVDRTSTGKVHGRPQTGQATSARSGLPGGSSPAPPDTHDASDTSHGTHGDSLDAHDTPRDTTHDGCHDDTHQGLGGLSSLRELDMRRCTGLQVASKHLHRLTSLRRLSLGSSFVEREELDGEFLGGIHHVHIH